MSFLEIYNEKVRDLLTAENNEDQNLDIKLVNGGVSSNNSGSTANKGPSDVTVPGLTVRPIQNESEVNLVQF